jgi:hypothetical protein
MHSIFSMKTQDHHPLHLHFKFKSLSILFIRPCPHSNFRSAIGTVRHFFVFLKSVLFLVIFNIKTTCRLQIKADWIFNVYFVAIYRE